MSARPGDPRPDDGRAADAPATPPASAFARAGGRKPGQIDSRTIHDGRVVHLAIDTVEFPDGSAGRIELVRHSGASAVLPVLDRDDDPDPRILLLRQFRYATGGFLLEVPAGRPDHPGEDWIACARRELREETGLAAARIVPLTSIWTTPGFSDELIHLFLAFDLTPGESSTDHDEFIEPVTMRLSEALQRVRDGEITDAKTLCTLLVAATFFLRPGD